MCLCGLHCHGGLLFLFSSSALEVLAGEDVPVPVTDRHRVAKFIVVATASLPAGKVRIKPHSASR